MATKKAVKKTGNEFVDRIVASVRAGMKAEKAGKKLTRHLVTIPDPPKELTAKQIKTLREKELKVSQHVFAIMLNVSPRTVQAWERNANQPNGPSLRLLHLARNNPQNFLSMFAS